MLDNITHMHEIRAFPMGWGGRGCGTGLELKIFLLKEFLFLQNKTLPLLLPVCSDWWGKDPMPWDPVASFVRGVVEKALSKGLRGSLGWWGVAGAGGAFCAGGKGKLS